MPTGPKGQKRPADVVGNAVHVMKVLTGEIVEEGSSMPIAARSEGVMDRLRASDHPACSKPATGRFRLRSTASVFGCVIISMPVAGLAHIAL